MKKEQLIQYRDLIKEINRLERRKQKLKDDKELSHDRVTASNSEFPYQQVSVTIEGYIDNTEKINRLNNILVNRKKKCENLKIEIEEYISSIRDSKVRQIFEMRYFEGMNWKNISNYYGSKHESYSRMIHDRYLSQK